MANVATHDETIKKYIFIRNRKEYFITLLSHYCKLRHKKEKGTTMCYYCEEFYLTFEKNHFNPYNLDIKDKNKYNRVIRSAGFFFILRHLVSYIKYHKTFEVIYVSENQ